MIVSHSKMYYSSHQQCIDVFVNDTKVGVYYWDLVSQGNSGWRPTLIPFQVKPIRSGHPPYKDMYLTDVIDAIVKKFTLAAKENPDGDLYQS